jgi:UPF0755 protein
VNSGGRRRKARIWVKGMAVGFGMLLCLVGLCIFAYWSSCPLPKNSDPISVEISPGASTRDIAAILHENQIIRSRFIFRVISRGLKADGRMQAGEYCFEPGIFVWDAIESLVEGKVVYYTLTVREGLCVEEIASLIEERGFGSKDRFLEIARNPELVSSFVSPGELEATIYPVEGYLFPDTYNVRKGILEEELVSMMLKRFSQVFTKELRDKAKNEGLSVHQASILASLVEKEAMVEKERPLIAAVYINRMNISMKLDADPTVLYALGRFNGTLLLKELEIDSPYNTYKYAGFPPGPISNFGKSSLESVLNPADVNYLYFVSKNDGTHAFSRTLSEHHRNVALYQGH